MFSPILQYALRRPAADGAARAATGSALVIETEPGVAVGRNAPPPARHLGWDGCRACLLLTLLIVFTAAAFANQPEFRLAPWPHEVATPRFELQDADGHPRTVASYAGDVVVVYFGFLSCPDQCPATLFKLAQVMKGLGPTRRP